MKYIRELIMGTVIGIANILPGISGGMLAITMGVYDSIIHAVTHLFKEPAKSIRLLLPYGIGVVAGTVCLSMIFEYLFGTYPLQTRMAFLGLIGGGLPALFEKAYGRTKRDRRVTGFLIPFFTCAVVVAVTVAAGLSIASRGQDVGNALSGPAALTSGRYWILRLFAIGILSAGTMVVPGVSGSMILMMLKVYEPLLQTTNGCVRALAAGSIPRLLSNGLVLVPYYGGMALGVFLFAGAVEQLLTRHEKGMYQVIIGLVCSSPAVILWNVAWSEVEVYEVLGGVSLCLLGYVLASRLGGEG